MENEEIYRDSIATWGIASQLIISIEEMSELIKEITKQIRFREDNRRKVLEEIADVELMLDELKWYYSGKEEVEIVKGEKLKRLIERLRLAVPPSPKGESVPA